MNVEIINIGDELLIGQVVNSNAAFMCELLLKNGFFVNKTLVIGDEREAIYNVIDEAFSENDIILMTGGLGPTKDDITKKVICDYFQTTLTIHQETLDFISNFLKNRDVPMSEINRCQAEVPKNCTVLPNTLGTAPGIWMEQNNKVLISLPGVPFEMETLLTDEVIPRLKQKFRPESHYINKVIQCTGIGESTLSDLIESWELQLPKYIHLAYLPQPGIIRLRLTGTGKNVEILEKEMNNEIEKLQKIAAPYIFAFQDDKLEQIIAKLLVEKNQTLSLAESCTGGYVAHLITSIAGSSRYFKGSVVSYSNEIKHNVLNVSEQSLNKFGAVSEEVVFEMAANARKLFNTDFSIAISGVAGPDGGSVAKPVGTVWIAVSTPTKTLCKKFSFGTAGGRIRVIQRSAVAALNMLRKEIISQ